MFILFVFRVKEGSAGRRVTAGRGDPTLACLHSCRMWKRLCNFAILAFRCTRVAITEQLGVGGKGWALVNAAARIHVDVDLEGNQERTPAKCTQDAQIVEPRAEVSGSDTESDRPNTLRGEDVCES